MWSDTIDSADFLDVVRPVLTHGGADELARVISERWTPHQLCQLLLEPCSDVKKAASLVLGLVGDDRVMPCLAKALHDEDVRVNELAEHALWSIWFRQGSAEAQVEFRRGLQAMEVNEIDHAVTWFRRAHRTDPLFAEAYNQCAIAHYMQEEWEESAEDCRSAIELIPIHFGALAGLGHCYAQMGRLMDAAHCYKQALAVNPRMDGIPAALAGIGKCLHGA